MKETRRLRGARRTGETHADSDNALWLVGLQLARYGEAAVESVPCPEPSGSAPADSSSREADSWGSGRAIEIGHVVFVLLLLAGEIPLLNLTFQGLFAEAWYAVAGLVVATQAAIIGGALYLGTLFAERRWMPIFLIVLVLALAVGVLALTRAGQVANRLNDPRAAESAISSTDEPAAQVPDEVVTLPLLFATLQLLFLTMATAVAFHSRKTRASRRRARARRRRARIREERDAYLSGVLAKAEPSVAALVDMLAMQDDRPPEPEEAGGQPVLVPGDERRNT